MVGPWPLLDNAQGRGTRESCPNHCHLTPDSRNWTQYLLLGLEADGGGVKAALG